MFFNKIKQSELKKEFERLLKNEKTRTSSDKIIKNVAILASEDISLAHNLQYYLESCFNFSKSDIYVYRKSDKKKSLSALYFSEDTIGKNGEIFNESFKDFLQYPFDLLVTFFDKKNLYLEYVTLYSKADFKVGFAGVNSELFDLEILTSISNIKVYNKEIKKYMQLLNKLKPV